MESITTILANEERRKILRKVIQNGIMMDDFMLSKVFEDRECTELLLRIIMQRADLKILDVRTEYKIYNLQGRSAIADIYAEDEQGRKYNIEVQNDSRGAAPERARYNLSLLDSNNLGKGAEVTELPTTYVIFITLEDVLKGDKPLYHIDRIIQETQQAFEDRAHIVYVNGSCRNNDSLGQLMQDFQQVNPNKMHYGVLAQRISDLKGQTKEDEMMEAIYSRLYSFVEAEYDKIARPRLLAEGEAKGRAEGEAIGEAKGRAEGEAKGVMEVATNLKRMGSLSDEQIAEATKLPLETVKAIV